MFVLGLCSILGINSSLRPKGLHDCASKIIPSLLMIFSGLQRSYESKFHLKLQIERERIFCWSFCIVWLLRIWYSISSGMFTKSKSAAIFFVKNKLCWMVKTVTMRVEVVKAKMLMKVEDVYRQSWDDYIVILNGVIPEHCMKFDILSGKSYQEFREVQYRNTKENVNVWAKAH